MGSNRRYGSPREQAAGRARAALDLTPHVPRTRHVWVRANQRRDAAAYPGLVVSWRRERDRADHPEWVAQVAYVPAGDQLTIAWVDAGRLMPAVVDPARDVFNRARGTR
ncbi:hypothetical protein [Solicola sp. PLA-1-18]|uniref:hypothetical protein n=1 Tax=Solicola sp. PLA-1-18 TaxID=3380532 RepID=UPI003B767D89